MKRNRSKNIDKAIKKFILVLEKIDNLDDIKKIHLSYVNITKAIKSTYSDVVSDLLITDLFSLCKLRIKIIERDYYAKLIDRINNIKI